MAGERSVGRVLGHLIFHVIGWRRCLAFLLSLAAGWLVAGLVMWGVLSAYPAQAFPTGDPILDDEFMAPERWDSTDPEYVARRTKAQAEHAAELEVYNQTTATRDLSLNIGGCVAVGLGIAMLSLLYAILRKRWLREPG